MNRGAGCVNRAHPDLWEPRVGNYPGRLRLRKMNSRSSAAGCRRALEKTCLLAPYRALYKGKNPLKLGQGLCLKLGQGLWQLVLRSDSSTGGGSVVGSGLTASQLI